MNSQRTTQPNHLIATSNTSKPTNRPERFTSSRSNNISTNAISIQVTTTETTSLIERQVESNSMECPVAICFCLCFAVSLIIFGVLDYYLNAQDCLSGYHPESKEKVCNHLNDATYAFGFIAASTGFICFLMTCRACMVAIGCLPKNPPNVGMPLDWF